MIKGKFIVLEGGEGAGKSTIARWLSEQFPKEKVLVTRAGGTPLGEQLKKVLVSEEGARMTSEGRFALAWAAHTDHVRQCVEAALSQGVSVLSDRFDSSTFAYQVWGEQAEHLAELFWKTRKAFLKECIPDIYVLLDVDAEEGLKRVQKNGRTTDHFEKRPIEFHKRVREGYLEFFKKVPHVIVGANRPLEEVQEDVMKVVSKFVRPSACAGLLACARRASRHADR